MPPLRTLDYAQAVGLKMLDQSNPHGLRMLEDLQKDAKRKAKRTGRDADPRRLLPLNGRAWQKLRAAVLAEEPLCRHCAARGLVVPADTVDHISGDPSDDSQGAHQSLCTPCHSIKTAADHGKATKQPVGIDGMPSAWRDAP